MLTLTDVSKGYGERTLFVNASLQINRGDRVGLVGPNGAGKSTLFALILNEETPDQGKMILDRRISIGHLPQEYMPVAAETVLELAMAITPEMAGLQQQLKTWEFAHEVDTDEYHRVHARFEMLGGYELEHRAKKILNGLGFRERDYDRPAREMSGGWVMRAQLAKLLVHAPDLLLLDEPTNHLDLEALLWFQDYLKSYPGAIMLISHDREFLNQLVGSIVEIRQNHLTRYRGNYDDYLEQREAQRAQQDAAYKNQQREIEHLMEFVNRFRAKNTKATQAQSKLKQIERMDIIEAPQDNERHTEFAFPQPVRSGQRVITLEAVRHAYGSTPVYENLSFEAQRGQRIVLVGPNGAGKSTLLKLLAGVLVPQAGKRELGHHVKAGYYSQYRIEMLHPDRTVLEEGLDTPQRVTETFVRTVLGTFGFTGDDVFKMVNVLSGGEKSRLALVKLLLDPPNLLLMDEPTTHLDIDGVEALVAALDPFEGTLIFISHDVFFIRALANHVVHVRDGQLRTYPGGYQYYLEKSVREAAQAEQAAKLAETNRTVDERPSAKAREQRRQLVAEQNARARRRRAHQQTVHALEQEITQLEQRQSELTTELQLPETYEKAGRAVAINRELSEIQARLPGLTAQWETAATLLAEFESAND